MRKEDMVEVKIIIKANINWLIDEGDLTRYLKKELERYYSPNLKIETVEIR